MPFFRYLYPFSHLFILLINLHSLMISCKDRCALTWRCLCVISGPHTHFIHINPSPNTPHSYHTNTFWTFLWRLPLLVTLKLGSTRGTITLPSLFIFLCATCRISTYWNSSNRNAIHLFSVDFSPILNSPYIGENQMAQIYFYIYCSILANGKNNVPSHSNLGPSTAFLMLFSGIDVLPTSTS